MTDEPDQPRVKAAIRSLRQVLAALERGEVTDAAIRVIELEEQRDDLLRTIQDLRGRYDVVREIAAAK